MTAAEARSQQQLMSKATRKRRASADTWSRAFEEPSAEHGDESKSATEERRGYTVLCIEADDMCATSLREDLERRGFDVLMASDALEGLSLLSSRRPDLVLCDASLPGVSAMDIWRRLYEIVPNRAGIPFIFLTGVRERKGKTAGRAFAAADFIAKAVDFETLAKSLDARLAGVVKPRLVPTRGGVLTAREIEVLTWVARGRSRNEIAETMGITVRTVIYHLKRAQARLGAATHTQAAVMAAIQGLIQP